MKEENESTKRREREGGKRALGRTRDEGERVKT